MAIERSIEKALSERIENICSQERHLNRILCGLVSDNVEIRDEALNLCFQVSAELASDYRYLANMALETGLCVDDVRWRCASVITEAANDGLTELLKISLEHAKATALYLASHYGYYKRVWFLLNNGAKVNAINLHGHTALHAACFEGHTDCIKLLLEHGADPRLRSNLGDTPAVCAMLASDDHTEIVSLIEARLAELPALSET